jgi:hypothetical protein
MAWGDILGGIGAAAGGVQQAYQFERELRAKEKLAQQQTELKEMLAKIGAESKEKVAEIGAGAKRDVAERNASARLTVQELANVGQLDIAKTRGEFERQIAELHAQNRITTTEMQNLNRLDLAEVNRQIQAAHDVSGERRATTAAEASKYGADTRSEAQHYTVDTEEAGRQKRWEGDQPLKQYGTEMKIRFPRGAQMRRNAPQAPTMGEWQAQKAAGGLPPSPFGPSATATGAAAAAGGGSSGSLFGPEVGATMPPPMPSRALPAQAMDPLAADAMQQAPPMFTAPDFQMGKPAGPSPFGPSPVMPSMNGPAPAPAAVLPPGQAAASGAMRGMWGPVLDALEGGGGFKSAAPPAAATPAPAAAPPVSDNKRKMDTAADLMRRITTAEGAGDFKTGRALRQVLGDLLK